MPGKPRIRPLALAIIRRDDLVFVNKSTDPATGETFYRPLGGRIEFGETGAEAVAREFMEEIGAALANIRYLRTFENIFTYAGRPGHEIVLMFEADFEDRSFYKKQEVTSELDKDEPIHACWLNIEFFVTGKAPLYPDGLLESLDELKSSESAH